MEGKGRRLVIDPVTRIEGHLKIEIEIDGNRIVHARSCGTLFRGIELILKGRDPRDAQHLTQRICGVCPAAHAMAASFALEDAFGVKPPENARIVRNLVIGANLIQSHVLHFYHLAALDYVKGPDVAPFVPRYKGDYRLSETVNKACVAHYLKALEIRRKAQEMLAVFGGKMPCHMTFVPGGVTEKVTSDKMTSFLWRLRELISFIDDVYVPDVLTVAEAYPDYFEIGVGCKNLLSYGAYELVGSGEDGRLLKRGAYVNGKLSDMDPGGIKERVKHSWYDGKTDGLHPKDGETRPALDKRGAYSWLKSPRYDDRVCEVGPLARMIVTYLRGDPTVKALVEETLARFNADITALFSVMGRHAARALECKVIAHAMEGWVTELKPGEPVYASCEVPEEAEGAGLTEAPRGALGHWIKIRDSKIDRYQVIPPTNWNASPRDNKGEPGPIEQALIGTPVADLRHPIEPVRVVRSFDPCLACSVHIVTSKGDLGAFIVG